MTKSVSGAMFNHINGEYQTRATCVKINRKDGTIMGFTDHDRDLQVNVDSDGLQTYEASTSSYNRTAIQSSAKMAPDNLDIQTLLDSSAINDDDIRNKLYDGAEFKMFQINWASIPDGIIRLRRGFLGEAKILAPGEAQIEFRGMLQSITRNIVEIIAPECRADLGDNRCTVSIIFPTSWAPSTSYTAENILDANVGSVVGPTGSRDITIPSGFLILLANAPSIFNSTDSNRNLTIPAGALELSLSLPTVKIGNSQPIIVNGGLNDLRFVCIQSGTSGSIEPVWSQSIGATIVDGGCIWRVDDGHRKIGAVTSVTSKRKFSDTGRGETSFFAPDEFFRERGHWEGGFVIFTSGANTGIAKEVKVYSNLSGTGTFTTWLEFPFDIQVGDLYEVTLGCDKTAGRCKFFKNIHNFRGELHVPGNDAIFDFPDAQN